MVETSRFTFPGESPLIFFGLRLDGRQFVPNYSGLINGFDFEQAMWDDNNHLNVVSTAWSQMNVYTVTPTSESSWVAVQPASISPVNIARSMLFLPCSAYSS
jgi:hypothetical protein